MARTKNRGLQQSFSPSYTAVSYTHLMQAGGIFDPVIAVQRILRLMPGEPPLVGHFVPGIGHK